MNFLGKNESVRKRKVSLLNETEDSATDQQKCKKKEGGQEPRSEGSCVITDTTTTTSTTTRDDDQKPSNQEDLNAVIKELLSEIKISEERLRKLKMVKMYREKNNLEKLEELIEKWRSVSQLALEDLLALHPSPQPSMTELLTHLQVDFDMVRYNQEDGSFVD